MGPLNYIFQSLFFIGLCNFQTLQCQEEVPWTQEFRLSWEDFKGAVPLGASAAATTASGISYDFSTIYKNDELKIDFSVLAFFYPSRSWYKPKVCNDVTLSHEQLHFDITELYARKMRAELQQAKFTKNVKAEVREIYKRTLRQLNDFQNKYDSETDYSRNRVVQQKWNTAIAEALK